MVVINILPLQLSLFEFVVLVLRYKITLYTAQSDFMFQWWDLMDKKKRLNLTCMNQPIDSFKTAKAVI